MVISFKYRGKKIQISLLKFGYYFYHFLSINSLRIYHQS